MLADASVHLLTTVPSSLAWFHLEWTSRPRAHPVWAPVTSKEVARGPGQAGLRRPNNDNVKHTVVSAQASARIASVGAIRRARKAGGAHARQAANVTEATVGTANSRMSPPRLDVPPTPVHD